MPTLPKQSNAALRSKSNKMEIYLLTKTGLVNIRGYYTTDTCVIVGKPPSDFSPEMKKIEIGL